MKKTLTILSLCLLTAKFASAQLIPSFEFGVKGGVNLTHFSKDISTLSSNNRAGYLGGVWARVGGLGFNFQPELYLTGKNVEIKDNNNNVSATAKFTSIDLPVLVGSKFGAMGVGARIFTGPLASFTVNKDQSLGNAFGKAVSLNYKDQNFAWVFGAGLDFNKLNIDLRYEYGLSKQNYNANGDQTRVSLFNLSLGYRLFSL